MKKTILAALALTLCQTLYAQHNCASGSCPHAKTATCAAEKKVNAKADTLKVDFELKGLDGKMHKLSNYVGKGNYVLLDFWASWCGPCMRELPFVKQAYDKYHDKGFDIVGVSLDMNKESWEGAIKSKAMNWHHLSDLKGWECSAAKLYGVRAIPATILFSPTGGIIATNLRGDALEAKLKELLEKK